MKPAFCFMFGALAALASCTSTALASDGALDTTFGAAGKVQLSAASEGHGGSSITGTDVAMQSTGKIVVAGYDDQNVCYVSRLNTDGSLDTSFGGVNGFPPGFTGYGECLATSLAVRPDDRIVVAQNNPAGAFTAVTQFTANGAPDNTFNGHGYANVVPASGDALYVSRLLIDSDGTIDVAGYYHQQSTNDNQFLFARISADGAAVEPLFQYEFGSGNNQDDHALDLAIDSQGRYVVVGYHRGANGNYDCAAIRIRHDLYDVDNTFGTGGQTTVAFDMGGDNGDFCSAVAIFRSSGDIALGGHVTADGSGNQDAALAMLDGNGNLDQYFSGGLLYPAKFAFTYDGGPPADAANTINKLIVDGYDTKAPQLLAIGSGFKTGVPYGDAFGIARIDPPGTYTNFSLDNTFNGGGTQNVYFHECPDGFGLLRTHNDGLSGAYANGKLVVAGDTSCTAASSTDIATARLAPFDGIFKNGFDTPSY